MFDACVLFKPSDEVKKRLNIIVGGSVISRDLKIDKKIVTFLDTQDVKMLRTALDMMLPFGVINAELIHERDSVHYPRAGIDDTLARIMGRKKIAVVFNLGLLLKYEGGKRARIIRRMKENMKRAVKYDIPVLLASCARNDFELFNNMQLKSWAYYLGVDNMNRVKESFSRIFFLK